MQITSSPGRATILAWFLALSSASAVEAQAQKGQHAARHHGNTANSAQQAAAKAARQPHPATAANPTATRNPTNGAHQNPSNESLVAALRSAMEPLNRAEHDDNGRRRRAAREIETAIRYLSITDGKASPGNTGLLKKTGANAETGPKNLRAAPDADLREAHQALQAVEAQMDINGINSHQFTRAKASVQNAIRELNLALVDL